MVVFFQIIRRALLGTLALLIVFAIAAVLYLESTLPSVEMLKDMRLQVPLKVFSNDGKLIAEFGNCDADGVLKKRSIRSNSPKGWGEVGITHFMALQTQMLEGNRIDDLFSI